MLKRKHLRPYSWLPDVFRIKGSIITRIIGPVLTVTLFSTTVAYASSKGYSVILSNSIMPMLSVVVGLILVFRNSTSYDRYWEGRKSFAQVMSNARSLSRQIWLNAVLPPADMEPLYMKGKGPQKDLSGAQLRRKKIEAIKLCLGFVFATKHYLRGEDGVNHADYQDLLPSYITHESLHSDSTVDSRSRSRQRMYDSIKPENNSSTPFAAKAPSESSYSITRRSSLDIDKTNKPDATKRVRVKRSKPQIADYATPLLSDLHNTTDLKALVIMPSMPLPLIIAHNLNRVLLKFKRDGFLETVGPAGTNQMTQIIASMVDHLTAMERVANTPIPISYSIHLKQCVSLYLFALPMTLIHELGWAMVPIVTVVAFTFMGIEGIADEIEMPFGTDKHGLPLDRYCADLKEEIYFLIDQLPEGGEGGYGYDNGEGDD